MLVADRQLTNEEEDELPAMVWLTLFSSYSHSGSSFFKDLYPCNLRENMQNLLLIEKYITLLKDTDHVYLDLLCNEEKLPNG